MVTLQWKKKQALFSNLNDLAPCPAFIPHTRVAEDGWLVRIGRDLHCLANCAKSGRTWEPSLPLSSMCAKLDVWIRLESRTNDALDLFRIQRKPDSPFCITFRTVDCDTIGRPHVNRKYVLFHAVWPWWQRRGISREVFCFVFEKQMSAKLHYALNSRSSPAVWILNDIKFLVFTLFRSAAKQSPCHCPDRFLGLGLWVQCCRLVKLWTGLLRKPRCFRLPSASDMVVFFFFSPAYLT